MIYNETMLCYDKEKLFSVTLLRRRGCGNLMEQEELISKKELLRRTGISYGQLYRWKRQNLIPESWFMKQSAHTGQETFFPKYKVLARISVILELKDQYSLEKLAVLFSPERAENTYQLETVKQKLHVSSIVLTACREAWGKDECSFLELLFIHIGNTLAKELEWTLVELKEWFETTNEWAAKFHTENRTISEQKIVMVYKGADHLFLLLNGTGNIWFDGQSRVIRTFDLAEKSKEVNLMLQHSSGG